MDKPKYNIGDVIFVGEWKAHEVHDLCPDCGDTRILKVTLFDDTEYVIPCETCKRGYEGPYGYVRRNAYHATVLEMVINGMEFGCYGSEKNVWQYKVGFEGSWCQQIPENEIFLDEQSALSFAINKGRQLEIDDAARVFLKEKPAHTWAWHVTYHRREIKRAQHDLEYHTRQLGIAKAKAKEA